MEKLEQGECAAFAEAFLRTMDPARAARAVGQEDGLALLSRAEVRGDVARLRRVLAESFTPEDTVRRLVELAFGRPNDCVRLALQEDVDIDRLDLSLLSEIKRSDKGGVEIKLMDRMRVIERLLELGGGQNDAAAELVQALRAACDADGEEEA